MNCRLCGHPHLVECLDLGHMPSANAFVSPERLRRPHTHYPLILQMCPECALVQTVDYTERHQLFHESYAYFSSFSSTWMDHVSLYANDMTKYLNLGPESLIVEAACNDGCLLQHFHEKGFNCLGIEPSSNVADRARSLGLNVLNDFFGLELGRKLASQGQLADLFTANNVLAHTPAIRDFVEGIKAILAPNGLATIEFPHLLNLVELNQFDTIYHEHYSYLSLLAVDRLFSECGLDIVDVSELPTHGGSLRIFVRHADWIGERTKAADEIIQREIEANLNLPDSLTALQHRAESIKRHLLRYLLDMADSGKTVYGYGAAAKGNTLLNFCGISPELLPCVIDASPRKQNTYLPGSHIPVRNEEALKAARPDAVLILPWNIGEEIKSQLHYIADWGGEFVTAIPQLSVTKARGTYG